MKSSERRVTPCMWYSKTTATATSTSASALSRSVCGIHGTCRIPGNTVYGTTTTAGTTPGITDIHGRSTPGTTTIGMIRGITDTGTIPGTTGIGITIPGMWVPVLRSRDSRPTAAAISANAASRRVRDAGKGFPEPVRTGVIPVLSRGLR